MISFNRIYNMLFGFVIGVVISGFILDVWYTHSIIMFIIFGLYLRFTQLIERDKSPEKTLDELIEERIAKYEKVAETATPNIDKKDPTS